MQALALVRARILTAKCVQETLVAAREALAKLDAAAQTAAQQLPAAVAQPATVAAGARPAAEPEQAEPDLVAGVSPSDSAPDAAR